MRDPLNAIHAFLTALMAWLYLVLSAPGDTFRAASGWRVFEELMPERAWATVFGLVAGLGFTGLVAGNAIWRRISVAVLATAHGTVGVFFYAGSAKDPVTGLMPIGAASGIYVLIATLGYWLCWQRSA